MDTRSRGRGRGGGGGRKHRGGGSRHGGGSGRKNNDHFRKNPSLQNGDTRGKKRSRLRTMDVDDKKFHSNKQRRNTSTHTLIVKNLPSIVDQEHLLRFLQSQANTPYFPVEYDFLEGRAFFVFADPSHAEPYVSLSGINYNSTQLDIHFVADRRSVAQKTGEIDNALPPFKQHICNHVQNVFDNIKGTLDLSSLKSYSEMQQVKIKWNSQDFWQEFFQLCERTVGKENIKGINLSDNNIHFLEPFAFLPNKFPNLILFGLSRNDITSFSELDFISNDRFQELEFTENPVTQLFSAEQLFSEVGYRFPNLRSLNGVAIQPPDIPQHRCPILPDVVPFYLDCQDTRGIAEAFLHQYFDTFDNQRSKLHNYYADHAYFSYVFNYDQSVNDNIPESMYQKFVFSARNLLTVPEDKRDKLLFYGPHPIENALSQFPQTLHSLDGVNVDSLLLNKAVADKRLLISVHGTMKTQEHSFSFDRSFILAPEENNKVIIVNDELTLRPFSILWTEQERMVKQFSQETEMNTYFSEMCLAANFWNYEYAKQNFLNLKAEGDLPDGAFTM
eukprot:gb/GECH01014691.1/.p1 GENE.gb/GECH01014691.1/~~gb/GECH01014691.1/.p1  ORF type:complete len:558 (+),score=119.38 gb/GECH01014691.1/:1-1674(+)